MRITGLHPRSEQVLRTRVASFPLIKFFEAAAGADGIDAPLGKDGAEPGLERTASVKVTEERPFRALATGQTIQLRKNGIREITGFRGTRLAAKNGGRRGAQRTRISGETKLPSVSDSFGPTRSHVKILN